LSKRVYIFVNGILNDPGSADGWTDRAVTWTNIHSDACGEKYEYACGALTRRLFQQRRAEKLAKMIDYYAHAFGRWDVVMVGHSNGCDVILRTLQLTNAPIAELHLVAAACEADFELNGLGNRIRSGQIRQVYVYMGGRDTALQWAQISGRLLRPFGLGYGSLGRTGPVNRPELFSSAVETIVEPEFGHSSWFEKANLENTMDEIVGRQF